MLRKPKVLFPETENTKLERTTSLPDQILSIEDIPFDLKVELSLFHSKSEYFIMEEVFDPIKFDSYLPASKSLFNQPSATSQSSKLEHKVWSNFEKLQSLADQLQITTEKAYIQYQLEILSSTIPLTAPPCNVEVPNRVEVSCYPEWNYRYE